jgi:hypothetical protein
MLSHASCFLDTLHAGPDATFSCLIAVHLTGTAVPELTREPASFVLMSAVVACACVGTGRLSHVPASLVLPRHTCLHDCCQQNWYLNNDVCGGDMCFVCTCLQGSPGRQCVIRSAAVLQGCLYGS